MDDHFKKQMHRNGLKYKRVLDGIIEKYSRLQYHAGGGWEVDIDTATTKELGHYMELSKRKLTELESKNTTELSEQSLGAQDVTALDVTAEDVTAQDVTALDVTAQDVTVQDVTVEDVTAEDVTAEDVTVEDDTALDVTSDTQSDDSLQDGGGADERVSTDPPGPSGGESFIWVSGHDCTELTASSLDGSASFSETSLQPEDQDEELEKTLRSQGSSLMELYPSMISQIGQAWHRQQVSEAAGSVLRRYQRLRRHNHTFNTTLRHKNNVSKAINSKAVVKRAPNSSLNMNVPRISNKRADGGLLSPLHTVTNLQDWQVEQQSPPERDPSRPVLVMDFSYSSGFSSAQENSEPKEMSLNQTFTVSQVAPTFSPPRQREQPAALTVSPARPSYPTRRLLSPSRQREQPAAALTVSPARPRYPTSRLLSPSRQREQPAALTVSPARPRYPTSRLLSPPQQREQPAALTVSPARPSYPTSRLLSPSRQREQPAALTVSPARLRYPTTDASMDPSLKFAPTTHTVQRDECPAENSAIHYSPSRQGPVRTRLVRPTREDRAGSPYARYRSPKADAVGSQSREPKKPRSLPASPSSLQKSIMPPRSLYPQDSYRPSQPKLHSPQSSTTSGRPRQYQRRSLDSSFPSNSVFRSSRELEDEFQKLYHRFVCQSKSSLVNGPPCRECARSSETNRGRHSSALAALALSPHRSVLRKRYRELDQGSSPQSKRSRDGYCAYSPGSQRHGNEMLRRRCQSATSLRCSTGLEASHDNLSYSRSKDATARVYSTQGRPRDTQQEERMAPGQPLTASTFYSRGPSIGEAKWRSGSSPRSRRRLLLIKE